MVARRDVGFLLVAIATEWAENETGRLVVFDTFWVVTLLRARLPGWMVVGVDVGIAVVGPTPRTIHHFFGFPREPFAVDYPAEDAPDVVAEPTQAGAAASAAGEWSSAARMWCATSGLDWWDESAEDG
ncbi:MAG: hypothetical protein ACRDRK_26845 [Pseudonocardia sp.]